MAVRCSSPAITMSASSRTYDSDPRVDRYIARARGWRRLKALEQRDARR